MSKNDFPVSYDEAAVYRIKVRGGLPSGWANWFDGLAVTLDENGDTLLTGLIIDQAALYGLLKKVRDLGLSLLALDCTEGFTPRPTGDETGQGRLME